MSVRATRREEGAAVRVDPETGVRETAGFFGANEELMFGYRYEPVGTPIGSLVICPPTHADFALTYRKEVLLARRLANRGMVVQRFHYRGTGNSDGDPTAVTIDSMIGDTREACEIARDRTEGPLALLGTRFGALVAAGLAKELPSAPLALWDPTLDADGHFREAVRALRVKAVTDGRASDRPQQERTLQGSGPLDIMGYPLEPALMRSAAGRTLLQELTTEPRSILIVNSVHGSKLPAAVHAVTEKLRAAGSDVVDRLVALEEPWWFTSATWVPVEFRESTQHLLEVTSDWFHSMFGGTRGA